MASISLLIKLFAFDNIGSLVVVPLFHLQEIHCDQDEDFEKHNKRKYDERQRTLIPYA
jgi:hypothetical protein